MDYVLNPTSIHRKLPGEGPEIMDVPAPDGSWALVLFASPELAETFQENTGAYPASEGFKATPIDHEGIRALQKLWPFPKVALYGPEPGTVGFFDTGEFVEMLEESLQEAWRR